jgi:hypothetical protein
MLHRPGASPAIDLSTNVLTTSVVAYMNVPPRSKFARASRSYGANGRIYIALTSIG